LKNGRETGRDCGKLACNTGCGTGSVCSSNADCRRSVCRADAIGPGQTDDLCGSGAGQLTCSCLAPLDLGFACEEDGDCLTGVCQGNPGTPTVAARCVVETCRNNKKDGT
jgi:hypothetical protein